VLTAALDTNTLGPSVRRDFLLSLAIDGLYRPLWSERTLEELEYCERHKLTARGETDEEASQRARILITRMREAVDDAVVSESRTRAAAPAGLPDPDDEHVLAGAFAAGAEVIVTENHRDFPPDPLPPGIVTIGPADSARDTVSVDPSRALAATLARAKRRSDTPLEEILRKLETTYLGGHILRDQLGVTEDVFWACVRDKVVPPRAATAQPGAGIPAALVHQLLAHEAPESDVAGMTRADALRRLNELWSGE